MFHILVTNMNVLNKEKKPYLLVDSSYVSYNRFFSTLIWYTNTHPNEEITEDYNFVENEEFMKHYDDYYMKSINKIRNMYNIPYENTIIVRDCPRDTIWRMDLYQEYKANRKNTCNFKNKRYNIGSIFRHIYYELYPELEEKYPLKIFKCENAEADDVIAIICRNIQKSDKERLIVIISNDNDYLQLVNERTLIWSLQNKLLNTKVERSAEDILLKKILKGDDSDNIPPVKSGIQEDFINKILENKQLLYQWLDENPNIKDRFEKNKRLIDFDEIPDNIKQIVNEKIFEDKVIDIEIVEPPKQKIRYIDINDIEGYFDVSLYKKNSSYPIKNLEKYYNPNRFSKYPKRRNFYKHYYYY